MPRPISPRPRSTNHGSALGRPRPASEATFASTDEVDMAQVIGEYDVYEGESVEDAPTMIWNGPRSYAPPPMPAVAAAPPSYAPPQPYAPPQQYAHPHAYAPAHHTMAPPPPSHPEIDRWQQTPMSMAIVGHLPPAPPPSYRPPSMPSIAPVAADSLAGGVMSFDQTARTMRPNAFASAKVQALFASGVGLGLASLVIFVAFAAGAFSSETRSARAHAAAQPPAQVTMMIPTANAAPIAPPRAVMAPTAPQPLVSLGVARDPAPVVADVMVPPEANDPIAPAAPPPQPRVTRTAPATATAPVVASPTTPANNGNANAVASTTRSTRGRAAQPGPLDLSDPAPAPQAPVAAAPIAPAPPAKPAHDESSAARETLAQAQQEIAGSL